MTTRLPMRGLLLADAISTTGTRISMLAIPWFVLTTTGSAGQTGLVAAVELTPLVLFKVLGGPFTDRYGARRVAVLCDLLSAFTVALIPLLHGLGALGFPTLLVLVGIIGALRGPAEGAKNAMVPAVTAAADVSLERVTGYCGAIERGASMVGSAAAGALIGWLGATAALYVDAASFVLCAVVLLATTGTLPRVEEGDRDPAPYVQQLSSGWRFLRGDAVLLGLALMVAATNLLDLAWSAVLMPVWGKQSGHGPEAVGLLFALWAAAATASALTAARWGEQLPRFHTYVLGFALTVPRFAALALGAPLWVCVALFALGGFSSGFLNPILGAVIFERIPDALVGRVSSMNTAICWSLMPLGGLVGGLLVQHLGLASALWGVGAAYLLVTMTPLLVPSFREFDTRPDRQPAPAATPG